MKKISFIILHLLLGSKVNKPSKILIKTLSIEKYIEFYIQNIETLRTNDPIIYYM